MSSYSSKVTFPLWKNRKSNKVFLTAREHFFVHQLLTKIFPGSEMTYALHAFVSRPNADYKITSREYERIKIEFSKLHSERMTGRYVSPETGKKISNIRKQYFKDPVNKKHYKEVLSKARAVSIENAKNKTKEMMDRVPDIIKNENAWSLRLGVIFFFIKIELHKLYFYIIFVKQKQGANYDRKNAEEIS